MTEYNLEFKDVKCTGVDWENDLFEFVYQGYTFRYKQERYVSQSADTDHIRVVINMFLESLNTNAVKNIFQLLKLIESKMEDLEEAMGECGEADSDYYEGKYQALYEMKDAILHFPTTQSEAS